MSTDTPPGRPGWLLDEVGSAGRENLDVDHVGRYDLIEDAGAAAEVLVLERLGLRDGSVVVELGTGTGTGQLAITVAPHCGTVVAVDVSPPMLDALRAKLSGSELDNVHVVEAGFLTYEHEGPSADVVYLRYALHHLPDFWKGVALARAFAMLCPGGFLRLWDVVYHVDDPAKAPAILEAWCATGGASGDASEWSREDLEEHVRDEHSTYTWVLEAVAERAGFVVEEAEYSADLIFAKYVLRRPAPTI